jgi:hypothetical protein
MDAFSKELYTQAEQGSENWHKIRAGRFTSSEIHRLMKSGSRLMTQTELDARPKTGKGSKSKYIEDPNEMSPDTVTYIRQKVAEVLTGRVKEGRMSEAMLNGIEWEPFAAEYYAQKFGVELEPAGFKIFGDHAGGSIDRRIIGVNEFLEIKCPESATHVGYMSLVDQWDLKRENAEYYWQCMANLHFGNFDLCHFMSFDFRMIEDRHKCVIIPIKPIAEDIDLIDVKITAAVREKLILLNDLNKIK